MCLVLIRSSLVILSVVILFCDLVILGIDHHHHILVLLGHHVILGLLLRQELLNLLDTARLNSRLVAPRARLG